MDRSTPSLTRLQLVASFALATDLAMGHPVEQGLGTCLVADRLADLAGLTADERARAISLALLRHIGCTTENDRLAALAGDEIRLSARLAPLSGASGSQYIRAIVGAGIEGLGPAAAAGRLARMLPAMREFDAINRAICEVAQGLARRLGFEERLVAEIGAVYERWDGTGFPNHLTGEAIPITIRVGQIADLVAVLNDLDHPDPVDMVRQRSGSGFDPTLAALAWEHRAELLDCLKVGSRWDSVERLDPGSDVLRDASLTEALGALADFADLKSPFLVGHSSGVARLAATAATHLPLPAMDVERVSHAGLVHDLGRIGVSARIWGKPGPLTAGEWEAVRLHPYHTDRLLRRAPYLAALATTASMHHERLDGSGYAHGAGADRLTPIARVLAAADVYHALTEPRPHRPAGAPSDAARTLEAEVRAGRLDRDATDAVLAAAGERPRRRKRYAADLTPRELEVLRLLARGRRTRDVAAALSISPRTAENHTRAIYDKVGVTTRAAATLFAMQHGLLDADAGVDEP